MGNQAFQNTGRALNLPPQHALVLRVLSGWTTILARLACTGGIRGIVERCVPGLNW